MAPSSYVTLGEGPDGGLCICLGEIALPCPGVALRFSAVIDCSPSKDRHAPITVDFLNSLPPPPPPSSSSSPPPPQQQKQGHGGGAGAQLAGRRFTMDSGDFVLLNQLPRVEAMVAAAGLPLECAPSVKCFVRKAASNATNAYYKAVGVTVEAGSPGSIVADDDEGEGEELEEVPPGADAGECAICYAEYLVGGATSASLPCGHTFHRRCIDRWTSVKRSCPYCRGPVDEEQNAYWDEDEDEEEEEEEEEEEGDYGYGSEHEGVDVSGGEEEQETSGSDWPDGLTHVVSLLGSWEI